MFEIPALFFSNLKLNLKDYLIIKLWNRNPQMKIQYFAQLHFLCLSKLLNLCFDMFLCVETSVCKVGIQFKRIK